MIQIDMPKPENCYGCIACNEYLMCAIPIDGRGWGENDVKDFSQCIPEWCPMKEWEAVEPTFKQDKDGIFVWACGSCGANMYHIYEGIDKAKEYAKYCRQCGKKVKWE